MGGRFMPSAFYFEVQEGQMATFLGKINDFSCRAGSFSSFLPIFVS